MLELLNVYQIMKFMKYTVKKIKYMKLKKIEVSVKDFISTEIEWIPLNNVIIPKDKFEEFSVFLDSLDNDDDVQNIYTNLKIERN